MIDLEVLYAEAECKAAGDSIELVRTIAVAEVATTAAVVVV